MKNGLTVLFVLISLAALSQAETSATKLRWGVSASVGYDLVRAEKFAGFTNAVTDKYEVAGQGGVRLSGGFTVSYRIKPKLYFRPHIHGALSNATVKYKFSTEPSRTYQVYPIAGELALIMEREFGEGKYIPTVLFGAAGNYNIEPFDPQLLQLKPFDAVLKIGAGLKNYAPKSTWSLDLVVSLGLLQLVESDGSIYNQATGLIQRNSIGLYFHFY